MLGSTEARLEDYYDRLEDRADQPPTGDVQTLIDVAREACEEFDFYSQVSVLTMQLLRDAVEACGEGE